MRQKIRYKALVVTNVSFYSLTLRPGAKYLFAARRMLLITLVSRPNIVKPHNAMLLTNIRMERCTDKDFGLSMEIPTTWADDSNDSYYVIFYAKPEKNYRSNIGFNKLSIRIENEKALHDYTEKNKEKLKREHYRYAEIGEKHFLHLEKPAYWHTFEWQDPEMEVAFCALHGFYWNSPSLIYDIKCLTVKPLQETHQPIFEHVLNSIKYVKRV